MSLDSTRFEAGRETGLETNAATGLDLRDSGRPGRPGRPRVAVVGGGLAGLQAALACADAGLQVSLFEARARLGGATWSSERDGLRLDNGQHVFLRCCLAYRDFLRRLGVEDRVVLQRRLAIPVAAPDGRLAWIRRSRLPSPAHLAPSLLAYHHLTSSERLQAALDVRALGRLDPESDAVDARRLGDWLAERGASERSIDHFWDLMVRATLNIPAREASLALVARVFQTGLLEAADAGDLGWSAVPLQSLHGEAAARALVEAGGSIRLRTPVSSIRVDDPARPVLRVGDRAVAFDAVIVAVPHQAVGGLLPKEAAVDADALERLGASPILNLHVGFDRRVMDHAVLACVDSPIQWLFDRTQSSGFEGGQLLALSLSGAEPWVGRSRAELREIFLPALAAILPAAGDARATFFRVHCDRAATFRQGPGMRRLRPGTRTATPRIFLAGAYTRTGWPATMEGACLSGLAAAREAALAVSARIDAAEEVPEEVPEDAAEGGDRMGSGCGAGGVRNE
jgi:squalene-associated FAD-dependent desaturase